MQPLNPKDRPEIPGNNNKKEFPRNPGSRDPSEGNQPSDRPDGPYGSSRQISENTPERNRLTSPPQQQKPSHNARDRSK